ncbi:hypothetical protein LSM04_004352 [Trypanosoma melophagium]|uniref:uncharacterized protein n=1 Tax=Trypanosoma melophagium TaxID=715481 RepID=UPI003519E9E7|nr:hypothetical protein LSM04_004352 [Trypanosoma melophagium]
MYCKETGWLRICLRTDDVDDDVDDTEYTRKEDIVLQAYEEERYRSASHGVPLEQPTDRLIELKEDESPREMSTEIVEVGSSTSP